MRKFLINLLFLFIGIAIGLGAYLLIFKNKEAAPALYINTGSQTDRTNPTTELLESDYSNIELLEFAYTAVSYIKANDYSSLASIVHPEFGLVFSPYTTVNLSSNKCFSVNQISSFSTDNTDYVWGVKENGEPIELTPSEYFAQYVYVHDYSNADLIGINKIVRSGNALENIEVVFPDSNYIDFYISGKNKENDSDTSWSILRLVFEEYENSLKLTAVIHSEYTA